MTTITISEEALGNNPAARKALFDAEEETELSDIQAIRKDLTNLLIKDETGKLKVPEKTADKVLLAQLLDGRERQVLTKARLKIASKSEENAQDLRANVAEVLRAFKSSAKPATPGDRNIPEEILKAVTPVPGEMSIGNIPMSIDEIAE